MNPKSESANKHVTKHKETSKPAWLLALEIVTGTMVGSLFVIGILTAIQRCNNKSSIIIPWKKSGSGKDYLAIHIGLVSLLSVMCLLLMFLYRCFEHLTLSMSRLGDVEGCDKV